MVDSRSVVNQPATGPVGGADPRRDLPSVAKLASAVAAERPELASWAVTEGARRVVEAARAELTDRLAAGPDEMPPPGPAIDWVTRALGEAQQLARRHPRTVVNATGVVLHTNLGRSPLAAGAADAVREVAVGYSDLELDLETGRRGSRLGVLEAKLCELSGAEAAHVCNNNAAALLLALDTIARGREVVVSRGELVEIGGSFRVPDIMERAGVKLIEVGTTNRTHPRDYAAAIGDRTGLLLKVHRSNFSVSGFVKEVSLDELVAIGAEHSVPVVEDLGSGTLVDLTARGFPAEAYVPSRVRTGAALICFSGDKLLGGPQAGILLGKREWITSVRQNPLARALRLDKLCLAALDWTLDAYLEGRAEQEIPVVRQMLAPLDVLEGRARRLAERLSELTKDVADVAVERDRAPVGGGSLPGFELDTWVVTLRGAKGRGATAIAAALRAVPLPVLTRVRDDAVIFDLRTLDDADAPRIEAALAAWVG